MKCTAEGLRETKATRKTIHDVHADTAELLRGQNDMEKTLDEAQADAVEHLRGQKDIQQTLAKTEERSQKWEARFQFLNCLPIDAESV